MALREETRSPSPDSVTSTACQVAIWTPEAHSAKWVLMQSSVSGSSGGIEREMLISIRSMPQ